MPKSKRSAVYCRISRDRTGAQAGVDRQEHDCCALVDRNGWELVDVFVDNDLSAYSGKPRPAFAAMLAAVAAGQVDVVVAWHPDRLVRHPRELEDLIDALEAARCPVETVMAGAVDLTTRSGRTTARIVGTVARDESEAKAERLQAMHEAKARAGEWSGGTRHYGYHPVDGALVVDREEAEVIREAAARVLAGESLHAICADLNRREVPTVKGASWRAPTLRRTLTSFTVAGRREHRGEDVGKAEWTAILPIAKWRRVRAVIERPDRARGRVARVSLLAGLVRCGCCGESLRTQRRSTGVRVYVCGARTLGGCGGISVVADPVDELVAATVSTFLDRADLAAEVAETENPGDGDELVELEQTLAELAGDLGAGRITRAEWLAARSPLEARIGAARAKVDTATGSAVIAAYTGKGDLLATSWPNLTLDQRRAIVGAVVDRVVIAPATRRGPGFDDGRVSIEWKA